MEGDHDIVYWWNEWTPHAPPLRLRLNFLAFLQIQTVCYTVYSAATLYIDEK